MLVSNEVDFALIGVTTLEWLRLEVDPVTSKLKESVAFLLREKSPDLHSPRASSPEISKG
jgi:hypothetical protein